MTLTEVTQVALITGGFTLAGIVATQAFHVVTQRREQEERYRLALYDKRLAVHQQAFEWTQKLGRTVFLADAGAPSAREIEQLDQKVRNFCDWYNANNLYLDPVSMHELVRLLTLCREWASGDSTKEAVSKQVEGAQRAIVKGIGLKHIDFEGIAADLRTIRGDPDG
jgi:hypothetical protein